MIRDFKTKNGSGTLIIEKAVFGIGFMLDFYAVRFDRPVVAFFSMDIIFIRFWWTFYKRQSNV